jgi:hypothetical protein
MADETQAKSMPRIVLPHWEEPQPPTLNPAPLLASVTVETVRQIRDALQSARMDAAS